jgi:cell division protein FtsB
MEYQYYRKTKPKVKTWLNKTMRKKNVVIPLLIAIPVISFMLFSKRGIIERISLESLKQEKIQERVQVKKQVEQLQKESKALDNDPKAIEKVAREKYTLTRENETVYKVKREQQ